jgi:O-antigen ligase
LTLLLALATVPAFVALAVRWLRSGRDRPSEEASRILLILIATGLLGANGQSLRWPILLAHAGITVWIAWRCWPDRSGLSPWVLVWAFYSSPLFPQKGLSSVWPAALAGWLWWHAGIAGLVPRGKGLLAGGLLPAWIALAAVWAASTAASPCPAPGAEMMRVWTPAILALVPLLWFAGRDEEAPVRIAASWAVGSAVVSCVLLTGKFLDTGFQHWGPRTAPLHLHPNAMAFWLVMGTAASVVWWLHGQRISLLVSSLTTLGVLVTGSKAGLAGLLVCAFVLAVAEGTRRRKLLFSGVLAVTGGAALACRASPIEGSFGDRIALLRAGMLCFLDRPWLGWGMGLGHLHLRFGWERIWQAPVLDWHTHNLFVETAQGTGVVGVVALFALFLVALRVGKGVYRFPLAMVALLGMADYVLHIGGEMGAVALALALCAPRQERRQRRISIGAAGVVLALAAVPAIPTASPQCPLDPAERLAAARRLWSAGSVDRSLDAYREAATMDPGGVRAVGVWEEGGIRCAEAGRREQALTMLSRAVLARPEVVHEDYWTTGPQSHNTEALGGLARVLRRAEEDARWARAKTEAGGVMLMWNLARAYYLSGRTEDASRVFNEIVDTPQVRRRMGAAEVWDRGEWVEAGFYDTLSQLQLTPGYFSAAFIGHTMPQAVRAGQPVQVRLIIQNTGTGLWPEGGATRLGYDWFRSDGTQLRDLAGRVWLPRDVGPGDSVELDVEIAVPRDPGSYRLVADMLVEQVAWFGSQGSMRLEIPVEVR